MTDIDLTPKNHRTRAEFLKQEFIGNDLFRAHCEQWRGELIGIAWADKCMDERREAFMSYEHLPRVRELGELIEDVGQVDLMQFVAESIAAMCPHSSDISGLLNIAWDGIGDWRA